MLKDAGLTAFVAAALSVFLVGFRTADMGSRSGLGFEYEFADLAIALVAVFCGRFGLSLAAAGLRWPVIALGTALLAIGISPLQLPSGFLHWFIGLGGFFLILRGVWAAFRETRRQWP